MNRLFELQDKLTQQQRLPLGDRYANYNLSLRGDGNLMPEKAQQLEEVVQLIENQFTLLLTQGGTFTPSTLKFSFGDHYFASLPPLEAALLSTNYFVVTKQENNQDITCYIDSKLKDNLSLYHDKLTVTQIVKRGRRVSNADESISTDIGLAGAIGETLVTACTALGLPFDNEATKAALYDIFFPLKAEDVIEIFTAAEKKQGKPLTELQKAQIVNKILQDDQRSSTQIEPSRYGFLLVKKILQNLSSTGTNN